MGADDKSIIKKCGEILINIKMKSKKNKIYTFNCAFCNENCDQLKKFSQHLEDKHFEVFSEDEIDKDLIYVPEIKAEVDIEIKDDFPKTSSIRTYYGDPLETIETNTPTFMDVDIKEEEIKDSNLYSNLQDIAVSDSIGDKNKHTADDESSKSNCKKNKNLQLSKLRNRKKVKSYHEDPLPDVKNKTKTKKSDVKNEFEEIEFYNKSSDFEHNDSPDEYNPDDSETEDDEIFEISTKKDKSEVVQEISPFTNTFMMTEINVKTLIELYKNQPNLWNKDFPHFRNKGKRQLIFQELTQDLNLKLNLNLTKEQTTDIISHICRQHRDDYKGKSKKEKTHNNNWYFEHLDFLLPKVNIQLEKLDLQQPDLTPEQITQILEIYKECPHLWNTNLVENICSNKRNEAHVVMLKMMETKMNLKTTKNVLEEYLNSIHNYFSREKRIRINKTLKKDNSAKEKEESTKTSDYYEQMLFLHDHEGPFYCTDCNRIYTKALTFRVHKFKHDGSIPLKCSQCQKDFKLLPSYITHAKRHFKDFEFPCTECDKSFFHYPELKKHLMNHTGARPFCCEICGTSFRFNHKLKKHQLRHDNNYTHTCHICSRGFYSKYKYNDHINSHLNIRSHICNICGKAFITSKALKTHAVTHDDARNHACSLCGKTFKLKIGVLQHMRTHGNNIGIDDKCN